jgi:hypothetical protein
VEDVLWLHPSPSSSAEANRPARTASRHTHERPPAPQSRLSDVRPPDPRRHFSATMAGLGGVRRGQAGMSASCRDRPGSQLRREIARGCSTPDRAAAPQPARPVDQVPSRRGDATGALQRPRDVRPGVGCIPRPVGSTAIAVLGARLEAQRPAEDTAQRLVAGEPAARCSSSCLSTCKASTTPRSSRPYTPAVPQ